MPADDLRPALAAAQMVEADRASRYLGMELIEVGDGDRFVAEFRGRSRAAGRLANGD